MTFAEQIIATVVEPPSSSAIGNFVFRPDGSKVYLTDQPIRNHVYHEESQLTMRNPPS